MLKCLEVLTNVVSGDDRLITMRVKQGHSESKLVAAMEVVPIFTMTWTSLEDIVMDHLYGEFHNSAKWTLLIDVVEWAIF